MFVDDDVDETFVDILFGHEEIVELHVDVETSDSFEAHEFVQLVGLDDCDHYRQFLLDAYGLDFRLVFLVLHYQLVFSY